VPAPTFNVTTLREADRLTVVMSGELDLAAAPLLEAAIHRRAFESDHSLVLDLRGLTFIDAAGLRVILRCHDLCVSRERGLSLIPGPPNVQRLFELTGVTGRLPFQSCPRGVEV
jgi:anti-sigma B factor antagonist